MKSFSRLFFVLFSLFALYSCEKPLDFSEADSFAESENNFNTSQQLLLTSSPEFKRFNAPLVVPVFLHIFKPKGSSTPSESDISKASQTLVNDFAVHDIEICIAEIKYHQTKLDFFTSGEDVFVEGYLNLCLGDKNMTGGGLAGGSGSSYQGIYAFATLGGSTNGIYRLYDQTISHETGHCFGLAHSQDINNIMYNGVNFSNTFTAEQVATMTDVLRTSEEHNTWHQYLDLSSIIYLGHSEQAIFNWQNPGNPDYSDVIQVTSWSVSPNLKISTTNGNSLTFTTKGCEGTGWINANIRIGPCTDISICKPISIRKQYPLYKGVAYRLPNYINYSCGSNSAECIIQDEFAPCNTCPQEL